MNADKHRYIDALYHLYLHSFRFNLTIAAGFCLAGKPAYAGGLTSCFLAENAEVTCFICTDSIILIIYLCALCASAKVNIYSLFLYS